MRFHRFRVAKFLPKGDGVKQREMYERYLRDALALTTPCLWYKVGVVSLELSPTAIVQVLQREQYLIIPCSCSLSFTNDSG